MRFVDEWKYGEPDTYLRNSSGGEVWSYGSVKESSFLANAGVVGRSLYNLGFETEFLNTKMKLLLGYLDQNNYWWITPDTSASGVTRFGGPGKYSEAPTDTYSADLQFSTPLFEKHLLTYGLSVKTSWTDVKEKSLTNWQDEDTHGATTYEARGRSRSYAIFTQDEIQLHKKLTAYIGFRQDWWETYDGYIAQSGVAGYPKSFSSRSQSAFSPKGGIVYKPFENTIFRGSIGRAFRAPGLYDLYRATTYQSGVTYASNPDLTPETITSWDIGLEQRLWRGATVRTTYFENYLKDMIYSKNTTSTLIDKVNAGKAENSGVEFEMEQKFGNWLKLFANLTFNDSKITENTASPSSVGKEMTYVPKTMFNIGGYLNRGPFDLSLVGRYRSEQYTRDDNTDTVKDVYGSYDEFFTVDGKVSYRIKPWVKVSFSVTNIMNEKYYQYSLAPGRCWFAELSMTF
jgi:iron complex outermembrane receptor protein